MNNLVKLVQASGKAILLPATDVQIIRDLEPAEKEAHPNGATAIWALFNGQAQSAVVRERFGYLLKKVGGASSERIELRGHNATRISMPRQIFANAIEGERDGADSTIVNTHLRGPAGPVAFHAAASATDIFDLLSTDQSDDDGSDDDA